MFPATSAAYQAIAAPGYPFLRITIDENPAYADLLFALFYSSKPGATFVLQALCGIDPADIDEPLIGRVGEPLRNAMSWIAQVDPSLMPLVVLAGANVNQRCQRTGFTPLYTAVSRRDLDLARRLLRLGATAALAADCVGSQSLPIERASIRGDTEMVSLLLTA